MSRRLKKNQMQQMLEPNSALQNMLRDDVTKFGLRLVVICYIVLAVPQMSEASLEVFNSMLFRLVMVGLIVMLCSVDAGLALLVAIAFVVSVNRLNQLQLNKSQMPQLSQQMMTQQGVSPYVRPQSRREDLDDVSVQSQALLASQSQGPVEGFQNAETMESDKFTSESQLYDCQNNFVGGEENQTNQVQSWKNELGPQGLSVPVGGSDANSLPAPFQGE